MSGFSSLVLCCDTCRHAERKESDDPCRTCVRLDKWQARKPKFGVGPGGLVTAMEDACHKACAESELATSAEAAVSRHEVRFHGAQMKSVGGP